MADCNSGAVQAEDIVKYGYMMIKRPPTSTKVRIKVCFIINISFNPFLSQHTCLNLMSNDLTVYSVIYFALLIMCCTCVPKLLGYCHALLIQVSSKFMLFSEIFM